MMLTKCRNFPSTYRVFNGGGGRILEGGVVTSRYRVANAGAHVPCMFFPHLFFRGRENVALKDGAEMRGK